MLRQSLKGVPGALAAMERLEIDTSRRAETVSVAEFVALARALS
jgi:16S rRNA (adenine1518-N6/adenine1519-N6)-dimethyltransferase